MALRELFAVFGIDFETKALNQGNAAISGAFSNLQKFGALVASSYITRGLYDLTTGVADFADELTDAGSAIGMSAKELLAWRTVGASVGVGAEQLRSVFGAFARNVDGANTGNAQARKSFEDLGVALKDATGAARPTGAILSETLTAIAAMPDPTGRAALAMRLLGEQGARLLPAFENGAGGLAEMQAQVEMLFGGSLEEAAAQADELEKQTALWDLSLMAIKTTLGLELLPALTELIHDGVQLISFFKEITKGTHVLEVAFGILGIAAGVAAIKMILPFLPAIATFALVALALGIVILVVDDLIAMFTGGNSVIAEFIDSMWGAGTSAEAVDYLKQAWEGLNLALTDGWNWISEIASKVGTAIGDFVVWADKINLVSGAWGTLKTILSSVWNVMKKVADVMGTINDVIMPTRFGVGETAAQRRIQANAPEDTNDRAHRMARFRANADATATGGVARLPGGGGTRQPAQVRQNNPVTINVSGAMDPEALAQSIDTRIRERQGSDLQDARNALMSTAD